MRAIFGPISIFAVALAAAFAQDSPAPADEARIDGSVVNKMSGAPVKRAHVMFYKLATAGAEEVYADTDAGGRYTAQLQAGQYRVWVERPGFSRLNYGASSTLGDGKILTLAPGQELHDVSFRISPLGAISGHVLDEDGDPVQGAGVQVLKFSYATGKRMLLSVSGTSSNDRGEYRAFGLPPGRYFLLVTQPGAPLSKPLSRGMLVADAQDFFAPLYYPGVLDFAEATPLVLGEGADSQDIDIRLRRTRVFTLRGRLLSPAENFADSQLAVTLAPRDGDSASYINRAAATLDRLSGRFEFHNVAPGLYELVAAQLYRGQALSGRLPIEVTSSGHGEEISIPVAAGSEITGSVELEGAAPDALRGTRVMLTETEGLALGPQPSAQVDAAGGFRLSGVTPGVWQVSISPLPKGAWLKDLILDAREIPGGIVDLASPSRGPFRIVLASNGAQLSGTATRDGQPSRATVVLAPAAADLRSSASNYLSISTDDQGNFAFSGVRPGSYKLFAFEDVEPYAWLDPDFLKSVDSLGQDVTLGEGEAVQKQVTAIPSDTVQPNP
ncbi:MAG TPA: carboxypeptidase regulatory-like domain-containing protein [Bryobacteraceae bacterium]|nr:carboxypeptidase regulatory-like domain-containing protein [Bryobacteraceae bacterium]